MVLLCLTACGASAWQEQYDLGVRYLSEGNYEEAIIAFTAAIEIDPKQPALYIRRAETYVQVAQTKENRKEAIEQYQIAFEDLKTAIDLDKMIEKDGYQYYKLENNYVMAVYPNDYYYLGEWKNGQRSGQGMWVCREAFENPNKTYYLYYGQWENDKPNGEGIIQIYRNIDNTQIEPNHTECIHENIRGTFKNGFYHGMIYISWKMNDGSQHEWSPITAIDGVFQPITNIPTAILQSPYHKSRLEQGMYVVALDMLMPEIGVALYYSADPKVIEGIEV